MARPSTSPGQDGKLRIFLNSRYRLICLDAETGTPVATFGDKGVVDLSQGLIWPIDRTHYTNTSPPVVYKDLVILGNGVGDRLVYKNDPPGRHPRVRRAHGQAGVELPHHPAARGARARDVAGRVDARAPATPTPGRR